MADSKLDREFLRTVLSLAAKAEVDRLLLVSDVPLSAEHLRGRPLKKKLVYAVSEDRLAQALRRQGYVCVTVPPYDYSRVEKVKVALVAAMTANVLADGENVLCLTGRSGARMPDTLIRLQIGRGFEEKAAIDTIGLGAEFNPQVVEALVSLAMAIGRARPIVDVTNSRDFKFGKGFSNDDYTSLPSAHVTVAFAPAVPGILKFSIRSLMSWTKFAAPAPFTTR